MSVLKPNSGSEVEDNDRIVLDGRQDFPGIRLQAFSRQVDIRVKEGGGIEGGKIILAEEQFQMTEQVLIHLGESQFDTGWGTDLDPDVAAGRSTIRGGFFERLCEPMRRQNGDVSNTF